MDADSLYVLLVAFALALIVPAIWLISTIHDRNLLKTVTSSKRGTKSERDLVLELLKKKIPAQTIFHDLVIEKRNEQYAQIDLVIATTEGIIVIEVKDYSGWIYGNGYATNWTKVLAYGKKKYRFYNPIKQNNSHIRSIRGQLPQLKNIPFFSVIVFYGECELKEITYVPQGTFIVKSHRIFDVLKHIKKNNEAAAYTNKREIVDLLAQAVRNGEHLDKQERHVQDVHELLGQDRVFK